MREMISPVDVLYTPVVLKRDLQLINISVWQKQYTEMTTNEPIVSITSDTSV